MADASSGRVRGGTGATELDSHANMVVIGAQGTIIKNMGKYADVNVFSPDVGTMSRVPIVDAVLGYDCPISGKTTLLVARNALFVESMDHNLISPFIMREAGLEVDKQAKIHSKDASKKNQLIYSHEIGLRIALQLEGIFSIFKTRKLSNEDIAEPGGYDLIYLTPDADSWDPNYEAWAEQEDDMVDTEGEILPHTCRVPVQIVDENDYCDVSGIEAIMISGERYDKCTDAVISSTYVNTPEGEMPDDFYIQDWQLGTDGVRAGVAATDARLDGTLLDAALSDRLEFLNSLWQSAPQQPTREVVSYLWKNYTN